MVGGGLDAGLEGEEIPLPKQLQRPLVQGDAGVGVHIVSITWEML